MRTPEDTHLPVGGVRRAILSYGVLYTAVQPHLELARTQWSCGALGFSAVSAELLPLRLGSVRRTQASARWRGCCEDGQRIRPVPYGRVY